ncbi:MAG: hypothetical protein IKO78_00165 [Bacilli bacterium]|nr:hypothetical protein [Bacilli bacterium]
MNKEYLDLALEKIIETIKDLPIPVMDKLELMINLQIFLKPSQYEGNIKTLQKRKESEKWK